MNTLIEIRRLLKNLGTSQMIPSPYETAWVATLKAKGTSETNPLPRFPQSLEWLHNNQNDDGSWGGPWPYYHDRLLSTLRVIVTLKMWNCHPEDKNQIKLGEAYIHQHADDLSKDPWKTVGFELIFPVLLAEGKKRGLNLPYDNFEEISKKRLHKLSRIPIDLVYQRNYAMGLNLEGYGDLDQHRAKTQPIQEDNGSIFMLPSATAFLLDQMPENDTAHDYLASVLEKSALDGAVPSFFPLEIFELSWAFYVFHKMMPDIYVHLKPETQATLEYFMSTASPNGWTFTYLETVKDADVTAVCFSVLSQAGYKLDPHLLYQYEEEESFRCYAFEQSPSISTNAHILDALHYCDPVEREPKVLKILNYLMTVQHPEGFWYDKWHVSPYYPTGRVIMAAFDFKPEMVQPAIEWILQTQRTSGGWGYYSETSEETSYALMALLTWKEAGHEVDLEALKRGARYLRQHYVSDPREFPPLWLYKGLYAPTQMIQAAILSALYACEKHNIDSFTAEEKDLSPAIEIFEMSDSSVHL